ncbi:basal body-orientation factor 1 isoform X1 [Vespa velutina]|uniref:basal body-orientation factor 1 isoform X1 n=1 Tax=Vespa velutina TaxID=202808 RepID=UPI001FB4657B|nr:basal body-orientation factor 1 isoform X1 [Vespa velutina]
MPKKKRGPRDKKSKKSPWLNERETLFYEQQILDNNRQLARLRTTNEELEHEVKTIKQQFTKLEEDRSDIVAYLKRNLTEKIEEARELNERISALEELRKNELASFKKKEAAMELEYRTMESNLSAEVKLAAGKLNALEDWRIARLDLMHKFEVQEQQLKEQEERHKKTLHAAEKELIIGKAKMQREMEERLNELAEKFREATNIRIADTTHRAVRENIALNQELDIMLEVCRELHSSTMDYKEAVKMLKLQADLFEAEKNITLNKTIKQKHIINNLAQDCNDMTDEYMKLKRFNYYLLNHTAILEEYKERSITAEKKVRILEQHLQQTKKSKTQILAEIYSKQQEFDNLNQILQEAKQCIMEALQLQEKLSAEDVCSSCYVDLKEEVLSSLLNILKKQSIPSISSHHISQQEEDIECHYEKGSLGLMQTTVEVREDQQGEEESLETKKEEKKESLSVHEKIPSCLLNDDSSDIISPSSSINHVHEII